MYGAQATTTLRRPRHWFENDVEMYGAQASTPSFLRSLGFENDVEMYGAQAVVFYIAEV